MRRLTTYLLLLLLASIPTYASTFPSGAPASTDNDDSCDIASLPAATLLVPYFEVDFTAPSSDAKNTVVTVTNVAPEPQVLHVVLWTDWGYPVFEFNLWLHGFDVQGISMYDVLARGVIPSTSSGSTRGPWSYSSNPNHSGAVSSNCLNLPGPVAAFVLAEMQDAFTGGFFDDPRTGVVEQEQVGGVHELAIGYITIDVVNDCLAYYPRSGSELPYVNHSDPAYYNSVLLFDNALIGDWSLIDPLAGTAGGQPTVQIRAIPEGGLAGPLSVGATVNFPYTFYDRYTPASDRTIDRRQPLPTVFGGRYIDDEANGDLTKFILWREGSNGTVSAVDLVEIVRFDENENPVVAIGGQSALSVAPDVGADALFPPDVSADLGGWIYVNLNNGGDESYGDPLRASQNWVTVLFGSQGRYGIAHSGTPFGNGCSPDPGLTGGGNPIAPAPNTTP